MKYYAAVTAFIAVAAWLSCVSTFKTQASIPRSFYETTVDPSSNFSTVPTKPQTPTSRMVKPDNRMVRADNRIPLVLPKDLRECRSIVDTLSYLNENTLQIMNTAPDRQH